MKKYSVNVINHDNEIIYTLKAKNKREVKNIINTYNFPSLYTVVKNDKLIKRLTSKSALKVINNSTNIF